MKQVFRLNLRSKISILTVMGVFVSIVALVGLAYSLTIEYNTLAKNEIDRLATSDLDHIAQGIYQMIEIQDKAVQLQADHSLNIIGQVLKQKGEIRLAAQKTAWQAVHTASQQTETLQLPNLMFGSQWSGQNSEAQTISPIVDEIQSQTGGIVTLYQRVNEQGELLSVATTRVGPDV